MAGRPGGEGWMRQYDEAKVLADDVMSKIQERNDLVRDGQDAEAARVTSAIRRKISGLNSKLEQLQSMLQGPEARDVTEKEARRRNDLLAALRGRSEHSAGLLRKARGGDDDRSALLGAGPAPRGAETDRTAELDTSGLVQLQRQVMREQDTALEDVARVVGNTKHIALAVHDELGLHQRLLDDLDGEVDQTQGRLALAQTRLKQVMKKANDWRFACAAGLCIVVLVLVCLLAFRVIPTRF